MRRTTIARAAFLAVLLPGSLPAQECGPDWGSGTGSAFAYWVEADGVQRSRHTNLATALAAMADSIRVREEEDAPAAEWHVLADFRGESRGPCAVAGDTVFVTDTVTVTDTVEVQLPPDTIVQVDTLTLVDTVTVVDTVEVCPEGWACTPPDTTAADAPPVPLGVYLRNNPLILRDDTVYVEIGWGEAAGEEPAPPEVDSIRVVLGANDDSFDPVEIMATGDSDVATMAPPVDGPVDLFGCVTYLDDDVPSPEAGCASLDGWTKPDSIAPQAGYYVHAFRPDGTSPTDVSEWSVGDSVRFELRLDCGLDASVDCGPTWRDSTATFADSVVFELNGERANRESRHPYNSPGDSNPFMVIPAVDTLELDWAVYGDGLLHEAADGDGVLEGGIAIPITDSSAELPEDQTLMEAAQYWAENEFRDPTGMRIYYVGDSPTPSSQPQYALGNERGVLWHWRASFAQTAEGEYCQLTKGAVVAEYPPVDDTAEPMIEWC